MIPSSIEVTNIPQLKDNYSYVISSKENDSAIIVDPAESSSILKFIKNKKLSIKAIILTHHHFDHTVGVLDIINDKDLKSFLKEVSSDMTVERILVRPSGTESKIRIMVEAPEKEVADKYAKDIEKIIRSKS